MNHTLKTNAPTGRGDDLSADVQLVTAMQACEILQVSKSYLALDRMKAKPSIPYLKLGRRSIRYRLSDVLAFLRRCTVGGADE